QNPGAVLRLRAERPATDNTSATSTHLAHSVVERTYRPRWQRHDSQHVCTHSPPPRPVRGVPATKRHQAAGLYILRTDLTHRLRLRSGTLTAPSAPVASRSGCR